MSKKINIYEEICTRFILEPRACYCRNSYYLDPRWIIVKDTRNNTYLKDPEHKKRRLTFANSQEAIGYLKNYLEKNEEK